MKGNVNESMSNPNSLPELDFLDGFVEAHLLNTNNTRTVSDLCRKATPSSNVEFGGICARLFARWHTC